MISTMCFSLVMFSFLLYEFYLNNYKKFEVNININYPENNESQLDLYMYCNELNKIYLKKKLNNIYKKKYNEFLINTDECKKEDEESFILHKEELSKVLLEIKDSHPYWIINKNFRKYKNLKCIILNLEELFNYDDNSFKNEDIYHLDKFCHQNKILFYIIGEIHPTTLHAIKPKFFNINNYISPYHYRGRTLGTPQKLLDCKYNDKPTNVSINKIILDVRNSLGLSTSEFIVIISKNINDVESINL